jgi:hypothetical protein
MSYSKLFSSIVHSSLWTEPDHIRLLFVTLLAIADREGNVWGSRLGLERLANISWDKETDRNPWEALMSPDSDSSDLLRNPENEGRRIEEVPGGFQILNFLYYRALRNDDDRRDQNRLSQRRHRAKKSAESRNKPKSATVSQDQPNSASVNRCHPISEAEAEAEAYVLSSKERTKERSGAERPKGFSSRKKELMSELRTILSKHEMAEFGDLWAKRVKHCPKAVAYAVEDYKLQSPDRKSAIKNRGAWLTDRHARALVEINQ